jgi:hypothetical protein
MLISATQQSRARVCLLHSSRANKLPLQGARVAQLDRVTASGAAGCGFDSRHAHHLRQELGTARVKGQSTSSGVTPAPGRHIIFYRTQVALPNRVTRVTSYNSTIAVCSNGALTWEKQLLSDEGVAWWAHPWPLSSWFLPSAGDILLATNSWPDGAIRQSSIPVSVSALMSGLEAS